MNFFLFKAINNLATRNIFLDKLMIIFSKYIPIIFALILAFIYFLGLKNKISKLKYLVSATAFLLLFNFLISYLLGAIHYFPRPFVNHEIHLLIPHKPTSSFPSSHAIGVMTIALGINNKVKKLGNILIVLSIIVGLSRIYVGHHYPMDIIGGFLISYTSNYLYVNFAEKKIKKSLISFFKSDIVNF